MFRSSSVLADRSLVQFKPVVELIASIPRGIWEIDADTYSPDTCRALEGLSSKIQQSLQFPEGRWPSRTLATKIMLGVFGNVPAFDTRVKAGLKTENMIRRFGSRALLRIGQFYQAHSQAIEDGRIPILDFDTSEPTQRRYTRAKVIDMIFYVEGGGRRNAADLSDLGCLRAPRAAWLLRRRVYGVGQVATSSHISPDKLTALNYRNFHEADYGSYRPGRTGGRLDIASTERCWLRTMPRSRKLPWTRGVP